MEYNQMLSVHVVFHIDNNEIQRLKMSLENIKNLLNEVDSENSYIALVANGASVNLFLHGNASDVDEDIKKLHDKGIKFFVCNNSIKKFNINRLDLLPEVDIVKAGVLTLIELQSEKKCSYIKP